MSNPRFEDNKLVYPCKWIYKLIGEDVQALEDDIRSLFSEKVYTFRESNKKGKYTSFSFELIVDSEMERDSIHMILKESPFIKMVI